MEIVKERYKDNNDLIFRLCYFMFVWNKNKYIIDYLLSVLNLSKEKLHQMMSYKCSKPNPNSLPYHKLGILDEVVNRSTFNALKTLVSFIGEQSFIDNIFINNDWNTLPLET